MKEGRIVGGIIVAMVLILGGALLMLPVGGERIRTASNLYEIGRLNLADKVERGVPVRVSFEAGRIQGDLQAAVVKVKSTEGMVTLGGVRPSDLEKGVFELIFPCDEKVLSNTPVTLILADETSGIIAQSESIELLPASYECFYRR